MTTTTQDSSIKLFKTRIRLVVTLLLSAVVAISIWSALSERRAILAAAERQTEGYASALAEHSESALSESDRILLDMLHDIRQKGGIANYDRQELFRDMQRQVGSAPQIGSLFLVDKNGEMFLNSIDFPAKPINVADRDYFRYYRSTPGADLTLGRPVMSRLVNRWRFNLMRPLNKPGDQFDGLITVAFEVEYFRKFFSAASLGKYGRIALIHTAGMPLVFEPYVANIYSADFSNSDLFRTRLTNAPSGTFHTDPNHNQIDKTPRIVSYQKLDRFPVVAVVSMDRDEVLSGWSSKIFMHSSLTIGLCLAMIVLMQMLMRHLDHLQKAQTALRRQQEQLRIKAAQVDAAQDGMIMLDENGCLVQVNEAFCRMTGYGQDELAGIQVQKLKPAEQGARTSANIKALLEEQAGTFDSAYLTKSGNVLPVEVSARAMASNGQQFIISIVRDVTERKQIERREQARSNILEELTSGASLPELLRHVVEFVEQELEGAVCSVLLADEDGKHLLHGAAPNLPDFYNKAVNGLRIAQGMGSCGTAAFTRQRVVVEDIEGHPYWKGFQPAREAGLRSCWSEPLVSSSGELLGTFAIYHREPCSPQQWELHLIESVGRLASIAIERFRTEELRQKLESQLQHIQRVEAVGQLAGGIAHDFNNLLTPIIVYAEMIKSKLPADDPLGAKTDGIVNAAGKARELTRQLLSFGRKQMLNLQTIDLNEVVAKFHDILRRTIRENITISTRPAPGKVIIRADRGQIEQILLNLAVNAQDAMNGNGSIVMETGHVVLDNEYARRHAGMQPGQYALLAFTDSGSGMTDDILRHIFEPFFTTKQVGHGTGLGLATVYGIVKQHDGYIKVTSLPGRGATFTIYLPEYRGEDRPAAAPKAVDTELSRKIRDTTLLVVDDNGMLLKMAVDLLESAGYNVLAAENPVEALKVFDSAATAIDLLVSDVVMPDMSGPELYEQLTRKHPKLPVLFISGYTNDIQLPRDMLHETVNFLPKPFTSEQLLTRIQLLLK